MVSKLESSMALKTQALNLRAQRQQMLAGNIANADTPNYKARDFDFSSALKNAMAGKVDGDLRLVTTAAGHLPGTAGGASVDLLYRKETQSSVDGNTVNMDVERSQFAENAIHYEALVNFISGDFKEMLSAIQSQ